MKRWAFRMLPIILQQHELLWSQRLSGVQTSRFLVHTKGGFAIFIINSASIIQKITSRRRVFDWILPLLCQFWLKSQHSYSERTSLGYNSSSICFDSHLFHRFCQRCTLCLPLFSPPSTSYPISFLTSQLSSALLGVGCPVLSPSVWPHTKLQPPLSSVWMCWFLLPSLWNDSV